MSAREPVAPSPVPVAPRNVAQSAHELAAIMFSDIAGYTAIMGRDEDEAIRALDVHRATLRSILPKYNGRLIGEIGDGTLSSFHSAIDAVNCAREVQALASNSPELRLRIGIHLGDVVFTNNTVLGDGVNVASRIHALAPPGGICISEHVYDEIRNKPGVHARDLGKKRLKNVARPVRAWALATAETDVSSSSLLGRVVFPIVPIGRPWLVVAVLALMILTGAVSYSPIRTEIEVAQALYLPLFLPRQFVQKIEYCTTSDGVRIAYGSIGTGTPVVFVVGWDTDLERGWSSGTYGSLPVQMLGTSHLIVQFDGRGSGRSDRGLKDYSLEPRVRDLEAVVDALKLKRFALWGTSAGGPTTIAYAARHPERVSRLVLFETFAKYDPNVLSPEERDRLQAFWGQMAKYWRNPAYGELMDALMMPDGTEVDRRWLREMDRIAATPEDAAAFIASGADIDTTAEARKIRAPTLVVQLRGDQIVPLEFGKQLAKLIPNSRLVIVEGRNHAAQPWFPEFKETASVIKPFLDQDDPPASTDASSH